MSKKVAASPLLIRHRYQNPFPPPPFPPKLLHISTDPTRYAGYRFLTHLENEREIQVLADADLGMPIELGLESDGGYGIGTYWEGDRNVICPDPSNSRAPASSLHPDDLALLIDPAPLPGSSISIGNGNASGHHGTPNRHSNANPAGSSTGSNLPASIPVSDRRKADVTWLRRTEYFNEIQRKTHDSPSLARSKSQVTLLPKTKTERLADIHSSFDVVKNQSLASLKHPKNPNLKAIDSFEILPDDKTWPNSYHLFRFQENPSDLNDNSNTSNETNDLRLERAILRPVKVKGEARLAYYLPETLEGTVNYQNLQRSTKTLDEFETGDEKDKAPTDNGHSESAHELKLIREYEISQSKYVNQHLLVFEDGKNPNGKRKRAAYFHPIGGFNILRKRRPRLNEQQQQLNYESEGLYDEGNQVWDVISISADKDLESLESIKESRKELLNEIKEPV